MTGLKWALLNQRHDCYDALKTTKLKLLLSGGFEITKKENAQLFIQKWNNETTKAYDDRLKVATYENNFGEIINDFGSSLFAKPLMVVPATDAEDDETPGEMPKGNEPYMELQRAFDLEGNSIAHFLHSKQTESNALSCAYFGMDFEGKKPYAYDIDPNSILDYQKDDQGDFIFVVLRDDSSVRTKITQSRDSITTTFMVWTKDNDVVKYETYRITYEKNEIPADDSELVVPLVESNIVDFVKIPIVECYTPDNLSVGKIIGQLAASSFVRYTSFLHALNRSSNPILAVKQGAELPANGDLSIINEDESRGASIIGGARSSGSALIGPNDEVYWAEIKGDCLRIFQAQLEADKNEMYRLVSQLGSVLTDKGAATTTKSSGQAKQMDNKAKENMLNAYAALVKCWAIKAFEIVFSANNFREDVKWQIKGMDNYQVIDEDALLKKIQALPDFKNNIPSQTSYKQVLIDVAYQSHPFTNPGTLHQIRQEISDAVDGMEEDSFGQGDPNEVSDLNANNSSNNKNSKNNSQASQSSEEVKIGESGHKIVENTSHLQTGEHVEWKVVYDILIQDYKPKDLEWVKLVSWRGPMEIDTTEISFAGSQDWKANKPGPGGIDKVNEFAEILSDKGWPELKPVILANMPHNDELYTVIDGRHRVMASKQSGVPVLAYVADVGSVDPETPHMQLHGKQIGSNNSSGG